MRYTLPLQLLVAASCVLASPLRPVNHELSRRDHPVDHPTGVPPFLEQPPQAQPDQGQPVQGQPVQGQPDQSQPGQGPFAPSQPGQGQPAQGQPAPGQPAPGQPAPGQSGVDKPPEVQQPPPGGQPAPGQSAPGQPAPGQPIQGQPGVNKPPEVQQPPPGGQPAQGQPGQGSFAPSQPGQGQPAQGQPAQGQPAQGQPAPGQPAQGQSAPGQPAQGQSAPGQPAQGQPSQDPAKTQQPSVVTLDEDIPQSLMKDLALKFKPYLKIDKQSCCAPWPAVSPDGTTSPGFGVLGDKIADCQKGKGQVYGRGINSHEAESFNHQYAIMYAWYFPTRYVSAMEGHKHDWQQIVVWLNYTGKGSNGTADDFSIDRIAYSGPAGYNVWTGKTDVGTSRPLVQYYKRGNFWGVEQASDKGDDQSLVMWDTFTTAAKNAVGNNTNFDGNTAPFSDAKKDAGGQGSTNFLDHLKAANQPLLGRD